MPSALENLVRRPAFLLDGPRDSSGLCVEAVNVVDAAVIAGRGALTAQLKDRFRDHFAISLHEGPRCFISGSTTVIATGPGTWLLLEEDPTHARVRSLAEAVSGLAAVTDVSGAYGVLQVSGSRARVLLSTGMFLDLHPLCFAVGQCAVTTMSHFGVVLWRMAGDSVFRLAVPRSVASSMWRWLTEQIAYSQ